MTRLLWVFLLLLLAGCSSNENYFFESGVVVKPDWKGSIFDNVVWSPDGKQIAYTKDSNLWVRNMETWGSRKIVSGSRVYSPVWIDTRNILFYTSDGSGNLRGNLRTVDSKSGKISLIADKVDFFDTISVYQNTVYLGERNKGLRTFDLSQKNVKPNEFTIPFASGDDFIVSPRGDKIAFLRSVYHEQGPGLKLRVYISFFDIATGKVETYDRLKVFELIYAYCLSPDGRYVAFAGQLPNKLPNLYIYRLGSDAEPAMLPLPGNAGSMDWSPVSNQIIYSTVGQPGVNEIRLITIPKEIVQ